MFTVLYRALKRALKSKAFQGLFLITLLLLGIGTVFYALVEHWRILDALYFCVMTLATIGYGDFSPQTDAGKIFTIFYALAGIGVLSALIVNLFNSFKENVAEKVAHHQEQEGALK